MLRVAGGREQCDPAAGAEESRGQFQILDLRCTVREQPVELIQQSFPYALPRTRADGTPLEKRAAPIASADGQHGKSHGVPIVGIMGALPQHGPERVASVVHS